MTCFHATPSCYVVVREKSIDIDYKNEARWVCRSQPLKSSVRRVVHHRARTGNQRREPDVKKELFRATALNRPTSRTMKTFTFLIVSNMKSAIVIHVLQGADAILSFRSFPRCIALQYLRGWEGAEGTWLHAGTTRHATRPRGPKSIHCTIWIKHHHNPVGRNKVRLSLESSMEYLFYPHPVLYIYISHGLHFLHQLLDVRTVQSFPPSHRLP